MELKIKNVNFLLLNMLLIFVTAQKKRTDVFEKKLQWAPKV